MCWWSAGAGGASGQGLGLVGATLRSVGRLRAAAAVGEQVKMVLAVRKDLGMGVGKVAAQCSHAAVGAVEAIRDGSGGDQWALPPHEEEGSSTAPPPPPSAAGAQAGPSPPTASSTGTGSSGSGNLKLDAALSLPQQQEQQRRWLEAWLGTGSAKIVVQAVGEEQLLGLAQAAQDRGVPAYVVRDAGRTQIAAGSATVVAIGPGPRSLVDTVTGHLKLF